MFTAGGNASGKTSAVAASGVDAEAQIVLDSTLSNPEHADRLLGAALEAQKTVTVLYVNRPVDEALLGMIERARTDGRVVTIDQLIKSQRGAAETIRGLWEKYEKDPRVAFYFLDNSADKTNEGGIETAKPQHYNESREQLNELLDDEYECERISEATYKRIRGSGGERSQPPEGEGRGGSGGGGTEPSSGTEASARKIGSRLPRS